MSVTKLLGKKQGKKVSEALSYITDSQSSTNIYKSVGDFDPFGMVDNAPAAVSMPPLSRSSDLDFIYGSDAKEISEKAFDLNAARAEYSRQNKIVSEGNLPTRAERAAEAQKAFDLNAAEAEYAKQNTAARDKLLARQEAQKAFDINAAQKEFDRQEAQKAFDINAAEAEYAKQNTAARDNSLAREEAQGAIKAFDLKHAEHEYAKQNKSFKEESKAALERVRGLETAGMEDNSISGLLNRRSEIMNDAIGSIEGYSRQDKIALNRLSYGSDYERPLTEIETAEINELSKSIERIGLRDENFFQKMSGRNATSGSPNGPTPPSSSNNPINPATTPTGSTNYSGYYQPSQGNTASSVSALDMINESGGAGIMASVGLGAILGGSANYAMGGEFGEGAVMGGLAGGAMKIGARAIQANETSIENYLQRTALGDQFTSGMTREQAGRAIRNMNEAPEGLMRGMAYNTLRSEAPSVGMQSRYAVMGGSMLSGVAFTGRRNDKRRGFNAHRGNRI